MSFACEICGKGITRNQKGIHKHSVQWRRRATLIATAWKPNLRRVKVNINGQSKRMRICTDCLKSTKLIATETVSTPKKVEQPASA